MMMGDGERDLVERLLQHAADVGAASRIAWLGTPEDIVAVLRTCTALVCLRDRGAPSRVRLALGGQRTPLARRQLRRPALRRGHCPRSARDLLRGRQEFLGWVPRPLPHQRRKTTS
jgi:hypothetical protein